MDYRPRITTKRAPFLTPHCGFGVATTLRWARMFDGSSSIIYPSRTHAAASLLREPLPELTLAIFYSAFLIRVPSPSVTRTNIVAIQRTTHILRTIGA